MKVLMIGNYDLEEYSRGRILYKGLIKNKVSVSLFLPKKNKYFNILKKIIKKDYDILLLTGKIVLLLAWFLKIFHKKRIIFDMFISDYDNLVNDRKLIRKNSLRAKLIWLMDKYSCKISNKVILDTNEHINYFINEFGINSNKFEKVSIGADETIFKPGYPTKKNNGKFIIHFHGTFIPLQGIEYIIKAAKILEKDKDIQFNIIGNGQTFEEIMELYSELKPNNINFIKPVKIENLPHYISKSDICLGIFGNTEKTKKVIPNKAYETIAMKKPLISSDTPGMRELFNDSNCEFCKISDEFSLASSIKKLKESTSRTKNLSKNGYDLFKSNYDTFSIGKSLKKIIIKELN